MADFNNGIIRDFDPNFIKVIQMIGCIPPPQIYKVILTYIPELILPLLCITPPTSDIDLSYIVKKSAMAGILDEVMMAMKISKIHNTQAIHFLAKYPKYQDKYTDFTNSSMICQYIASNKGNHRGYNVYNRCKSMLSKSNINHLINYRIPSVIDDQIRTTNRVKFKRIDPINVPQSGDKDTILKVERLDLYQTLALYKLDEIKMVNMDIFTQEDWDILDSAFTTKPLDFTLPNIDG